MIWEGDIALPITHIILTQAQISVANSKVYCKLGNGTVRDLTQDTNTVYTHPTTKQCTWNPDLSNINAALLNGMNASQIISQAVASSGSTSVVIKSGSGDSVTVSHTSTIRAAIVTLAGYTFTDPVNGSWAFPNTFVVGDTEYNVCIVARVRNDVQAYGRVSISSINGTYFTMNGVYAGNVSYPINYIALLFV